MAADKPDLLAYLSSKNSYISPDNQNEFLDLMGQSILRQITNQIRASGWYTLMMDESTNNANQEQTVFCLRLAFIIFVLSAQ